MLKSSLSSYEAQSRTYETEAKAEYPRSRTPVVGSTLCKNIVATALTRTCRVPQNDDLAPTLGPGSLFLEPGLPPVKRLVILDDLEMKGVDRLKNLQTLFGTSRATRA